MQIGFQLRKLCPLCQSASHRNLVDISYQDKRLAQFIGEFYQDRVDLTALDSANYQVLACNQCDFLFQASVLDGPGMKVLYCDWIDQERSLHKKQTAGAKLFRRYAGQVQTLLRLFDKPPAQVRVLDYGMGWGYWARMAQAHGLDVVGFELAAERVDFARNMGVRIVDSLPSQGIHFDFINANQVFEHLPDPLQSLRDLADQLQPAGVISIRVPDGRNLERRLRESGWSPELDAIHPLEHINCFTRKTLIQLGASAGLRPFNPPLRLNLNAIWGGLRREFMDRLLTTHLFFRR